jgi:hypothetical protein
MNITGYMKVSIQITGEDDKVIELKEESCEK